MSQIYTSHWRSPLLEDADAQIISISRGVPRWRLPFAYRRLRELAPNDRVWAHEDTAEFETAYLGQLEAIGADAILARMEYLIDNRAAILLCWEKPHESFCHRWVLARFIEEETGIMVPELEPGDVPRRPDSPQPVLFDGYREERT